MCAGAAVLTGEFYPFRNEGRDGAETIAWLRTHAACNGRIGMYGFSYQGATQLLAAAEQPEGLQCIAPHMTAADLYHGWFYHQGALRLSSTLGWGIQMLREDARRRACAKPATNWKPRGPTFARRLRTFPMRDHPAITDPALPSYVRDWFAHREPGEYWTAQDISTRIDRIQIPALHIAGWFDTYLEGSIAGYLALRKGAGSEFARENQYLIAGPWVHIPWGDRVGDANLGEAANLNTDEILLRWFNHWLKDSGEFDGRAAHPLFLRWAPTTGAARTSGRRRRHTRFICAARAMRIRAKATAVFRRHAPTAKSRAMCLSTILRCRSSRPAARRR